MAPSRKNEVEQVLPTIDLDSTEYTAEVETSQGPIRLTFFSDKAPGHVKNFVALAKIGYYDNLIFHRIIKSFMIQGGCPDGRGSGGPGYTIDAEFNDTPHEPGVLSAARTSDPNSAGSQFFICTGKHTHLDGQYTAYGKVMDQESMDTVTKIAALPTKSEDRPVKEADATIQKVTIHETPK